MTVRGYGFFYYIAEAFRGLRSNGLVNLLAVGTIGTAMLIAGFLLLVALNVRTAVHAVGGRLEMSVYLKDGLSPAEKDRLRSRIAAEPDVRKIAFLDKSAALALLRWDVTDQDDLIEGLGKNPLPESFELELDRRGAEAGRFDILADRLGRLAGVEDVAYAKRGAEMLAGLSTLLSYGSAALAILLAVSVVFIIANSVRLALYSRGQEIEIMQWIGATKGFIQWPFLIEGMLIAMLGAALAIGVLATIYVFLPEPVILLLSRLGGPEFLPPAAIGGMMAVSGFLGFAGGLVSVNQYLE